MTPTVDQSAYRQGRIVWTAFLAFQTRQAEEAHLFLVLAAALLVWLRPQPERFAPNP